MAPLRHQQKSTRDKARAIVDTMFRAWNFNRPKTICVGLPDGDRNQINPISAHFSQYFRLLGSQFRLNTTTQKRWQKLWNMALIHTIKSSTSPFYQTTLSLTNWIISKILSFRPNAHSSLYSETRLMKR